jgi:hypothetical protein
MGGEQGNTHASNRVGLSNGKEILKITWYLLNNVVNSYMYINAFRIYKVDMEAFPEL